MEQQYKFWESVEDREIRLKKLWIDLKRKNALGGIDATTTEEQQSLNEEITETVRRIRWRMDQELTRRNIEPVFKDNYAGKYDKDEFLIDAGMEFFKIKKLLSKNPKLLKDDPVLSLDYFKIINLIKRKKLVEDTSDHFNASDSVNTVWNDMSMIDKDQSEKERLAFEKYSKNQVLNLDEADVSEKMSLGGAEEESEDGVRSAKKKELREHQKII